MKQSSKGPQKQLNTKTQWEEEKIVSCLLGLYYERPTQNKNKRIKGEKLKNLKNALQIEFKITRSF